MLGKLIKYEFKATTRRIVPVLLILLGMSLIAGYVLPALYHSQYRAVNFFYYIGFILYVISFFAVGIVALILLIERFRKHVLGNEGYSTMTLPVTVHEILWSKLIVFFVWSVVITAAIVVSAFAEKKFVPNQFLEFVQYIADLLPEVKDVSFIDYVLYFLEWLVMIFVMFSDTCLCVFASLMIGQQASKAKMFISVLVYIGFSVTFSFIGTIGLIVAEEVSPVFRDGYADVIVSSKMHLGFLNAIVITAIPAAVYYLIAALGMKKRLNLE